MTIRRIRYQLRWFVTAFVASALVVGCSSAPPPEDETDSNANVNLAATALLPTDIASSGVLRAVTDPNAAPFTFIAPGDTFAGFDIELAELIAESLGLELQVRSVTFPELLPAIVSGGADIAISGLFITEDRLNDVDFVSYLSGGTAWLVLSSDSLDDSVSQTCALRVGAVADTFQATVDIPARSLTCLQDGFPPLDLETFTSTNDGIRALLNSDIDAFVADAPVAQWAAEQSKGLLQLGGTPYNVLEYGIAVSPQQPQLAAAIRQALIGLLDQGRYQRLSGKWGVDGGSLLTSRIRTTNAQ